MTTYGDANLPITLKTTTVVQEGLTTKTVEKVHDSDSIPAVTIGAVVSGLKIINYANEPYGAGLTKQTITYEGADSVGNPLPSTTYDSQGSMVELDIRQHPDWATEFEPDWDADKGEFIPTSPYYGISSYIVGSVTVTKTEYFATQPTDRYEDIGTKETPGGGYTGTNKWLIIGTSRRKVGEALYTRETQYLYSAKGWNTTVYPD
jgi:hypothetical protein